MKIWQSKEINRLISAAVVDQKFCALLLNNTEQALEGYLNERFDLSSIEREFILSIHADSLEEFTGKMINGDANTHLKNGKNGFYRTNGNGHHAKF